MALKSMKTEKVMTEKKAKKKHRPNWVLRISILVVAVPVLILAFVLLTSLEKKGEPVDGDRFKTHLDPEIKDSSLKSIKSALAYDNVDKVEVNLISATLRITIDVNDALDAASIENITNDAYEKVNGIIPIGTYFTNHDKVKMYDLEINVYNLIPNENTQVTQIWAVKHKNASEEEAGFDWITTPRNDKVVEDVTKPIEKVPEEQLGQDQ